MFGVGTSPIYLGLLSPYQGNHGKVVLLCSEAVNSGYEHLGMDFVRFKGIFRSEVLPDASASQASSRKMASKYVTSKSASSGRGNLPTNGPPDRIPVNKSGERIDFFIRPPTREEWEAYESRSQAKKLCNEFHMKNCCTDAGCEFDHTALDAAALHCLKFILKSYPCVDGRECRRLDRPNGHVCQNCKGKYDDRTTCRMPKAVQRIDWKVTNWVKPRDESGNEDTGTSLARLKGNGSLPIPSETAFESAFPKEPSRTPAIRQGRPPSELSISIMNQPEEIRDLIDFSP